MAQRYSGDIVVRMKCEMRKGRLFYVASVAAPGHRGRAILSPRECGVWRGNPRTPENYDRAARAFVVYAARQAQIGQHASWKGGRLEILRVQQAPCPGIGYLLRER